MGIRITTAMMADAMGVPVQTIRVGIQHGVYPFGAVVKKNPKQHRGNYVIYPEQARQTLGDARYNDMLAKAAADTRSEYKPLQAI